MHTNPLWIEGLAGPVQVIVNDLTGGSTVTVGGHAAPKAGRGRFLLPTVHGDQVEGRVRGSLVDPFPTLEVNGIRHRTGPKQPVILGILTFLPLVCALLGVIGIMTNLVISRSSLSVHYKAFLMVGVLLANIALVIGVNAALST